MHQKVYLKMTAAGCKALVAANTVAGGSLVVCDNGTDMFGIVYPKHASTRFDVAAHDGVTVLPSHLDPTPIGATVAAALAHVNAQPHETMRDVALRLHEKFGPAFHPET